MKIMDLSGDDGECQVDAVVDSKTKKSKQGKSFCLLLSKLLLQLSL